jgi:hypothetical protein
MWHFLMACQNQATIDQNTLISEWSTDKRSVVEALTLEQNPLKKLLQITVLTEHFPGQTTDLCILLEQSVDRNRCEQLNQRPHLWAESTPSTELEAPAALDSKTPSDCPKNELYRGCITSQAISEAQRGTAVLAQGTCTNIDEMMWRSECLFSAAEAAVLQRGAHGYGAAAELCIVADRFAENCLQHLVMLLAKSAPNANTVDDSDWEAIRQAERAIQTTWSWRAPERILPYTDRLWSESISLAYAAARPISGIPMDLLPEKSAHIHSAVVRKLMELENPNSHSLEEWVHLVESVLAQRHPQNGARDTDLNVADFSDLWEESEHPSIVLMGTSRREVSSNSQTDISICVLETASRIPPISESLLEEGLNSDHPEVSRTASRLMRQLKETTPKETP